MVHAKVHAINDATSAKIASFRVKIDVLDTFLRAPNLPPELRALIVSRTKKGKGEAGSKGSPSNKLASNSKTNANNVCNGKKKAATSGPATQSCEEAGGRGSASNGKRVASKGDHSTTLQIEHPTAERDAKPTLQHAPLLGGVPGQHAAAL